ncbi:MASE1 domain-containing protein [Methylocaldum sp.]|uniref:sensor histidine kinase n=1 Tax=Methylocaldum sp. TaxID=1969727 RepID=UPI002D6FFEBF|nr:MASE1 domain-containing protein [Methylocaldum sp.]HYE37417.1 MASE1 domain-containing protein [Methylocaldum sp.]
MLPLYTILRSPAGLYGLQVALLAGTYFLTAKLGLSLAIPPGNASVVWPPAGIALAAVLVFGRRLWPGIGLGAGLANASTEVSPLGAMSISLGNTVEALVGAFLLNRFSRPIVPFERVRHVFLFAFFAAVSSVIAATLGVTSLYWDGLIEESAYGINWITWWLGDIVSLLVITPSLLLVRQSARNTAIPIRLEPLCFYGLLVISGLAVFGHWLPSSIIKPLPYTLIPFVLYAAFRMGQEHVAITLTGIAAVAILATVLGSGPFAGMPLHQSLFSLQAFIGSSTLIGFTLSAVVLHRRRVEEALLESEARLRERTELLECILATTDSPIFIKDKAGRYLACNDALLRLFSFRSEDVIGRTEFEVFPREMAQQFRDNDLRLLAKGGTERFEEIIRLPNGKQRLYLSNKGAYRDAAGRPAGIVGISTDITERKHMEEVLRETDQRKNEFIAMLGHELRNPLAPIQNAVRILGKLNPGDPKLNWARDMIDRQVNHLARLVDDLLDVSRIVQGKLTLRKAPVDLARVIDQAIETSRPFIEERRHAFAVSVPEQPVRFEGDHVRLAQVVTNLLDNAAKYTPAGGRIWLTVSCKDDEVIISVRDTGEGISGALLPHLFDVFTQAERTLDRAQGGLGIGLTIVQKIVELHGGRVEAHSEGSGRGSEFVVRLPVPVH